MANDDNPAPTAIAAAARSSRPGRPAPHPRAAALAFGSGFLVLGICGLLRSAKVYVDNASLAAMVLLALGAAGLWTVVSRSKTGSTAG